MRNNQFNHGIVDRNESASAATRPLRSASVISEFSSSRFQSQNASTTANATPIMDRMRPRAASEAAAEQQTQSSILIGPPSLYHYRDPETETAKVETGKYANGANNLSMGAETALYYEIEFKRFRKEIYIGAANFRVGDYVKVMD